MNDLALAGHVGIGLSHFTALGLASILDEDGAGAVSTWWSDRRDTQVFVRSELSDVALAERVIAHARRHTESDSWVQRRVTRGPRAGVGLFTARVKAPADAREWLDYAAERDAARASTSWSQLDERMQLALGEPAWWRCSIKEIRPDDGASRWEMKTRNQGQEFLVHRLAPLAESVAARTTESVLDGLRGTSIVDEVGKDAADSRTATGLAPLGPVDNAVAWCALWGLSVAPTIWKASGVADSAGVWPRNIVHPRHAALPVFSRPASPRTFGDILASKRFDVACAWTDDISPDVLAARLWLADHGVRAILRMEVDKLGSPSAPERRLLDGTQDTL